MATVSIKFINGSNPDDIDQVLLNFNFESTELNSQYLIRCFYKRLKRFEPEEWVQFNEFAVGVNKTIITKNIKYNFVRDTQFQQSIVIKCELYRLAAEVISQELFLR